MSRLKIDETAKTVEISVRELAEGEEYQRIGFERGEGWNRLGLGAELHTRVLKARCQSDPNYRAEVFLQMRAVVEDWTVIISGRLDGCVPMKSGGWRIEEFKSAYLPTCETRPSGGAFERHKRQVLLYCHIWHHLGNSPVTGDLVYVDLASGKENVIRVEYDETEVERETQRALQRLIAIWRAEAKNRVKKAVAGAVLPFPHQEPRPGQKILIEAIGHALQEGKHLLAEAPTGSGKTAAGLHPALAQGLKTGQQVVFLTSKTLQQKMAVSALKGMNCEGVFRTQQIRAKEKMCANDRVLCHEDFCPYARNFPEKMEKSGVLERIRKKHWHLDPDAIFEEAKREEVCPFEVQLELAGKVDALVADYNYVFEPGVALRHFEGDEPIILMVDEAHNLPDRARKIFSPELCEETFRALTSRLLFQPGELFELLSGVVEKAIRLLRASAKILPPGLSIAETEPPADDLREIWKEWELLFVRYLGWKKELKMAVDEDPIVDLHFLMQRFIAVLNLYGEGFTCVVERQPAGIRLAIVCLDPARALGPVFKSTSSSVLLSATLSPLEVMRRVLGLEKKRTQSVSLPPPFPRENRKILILPQVRTTFAVREKNFLPIARHIAEMSDAQPGNALVLFPSYQFLQRVHELLPPTRAQVYIQRSDFSETERKQIFNVLASPPKEGILLMAVLGGMYAEGVDYPGELLSAVFVVSPALPQVSFERELLRRYFDLTEQAGFEYAYLQPGMTRVVQAAGRLIRSETDRGVIALLCARFLQEPYVSHLPRDWYDQRPSELIARNPAQEVRAFFDK